MQRFRAALLALGLVAVLAGLGAGALASRAVEDRDHDLRLAGASRVTALDDYAERARSASLLASHSAAFTNFYRAPGSRQSTGSPDSHRRGRPDGPSRAVLHDLETLFPRRVASSSFIDRSGPRTPGSSRAGAVDSDGPRPRPHPRGVLRPGLRPALRQGLPVRALPLGVHRRLGRRLRRQGQHRSRRALPGDRLLRAHRGELPARRLRRQSRPRGPGRGPHDGRVVIDSTHPQDVGVPLGNPDDHSLRWVQVARDGQLASAGGERSVVRFARTDNKIAVGVGGRPSRPPRGPGSGAGRSPAARSAWWSSARHADPVDGRLRAARPVDVPGSATGRAHGAAQPPGRARVGRGDAHPRARAGRHPLRPGPLQARQRLARPPRGRPAARRHRAAARRRRP